MHIHISNKLLGQHNSYQCFLKKILKKELHSPKMCGYGVDSFFNDALRHLPAGKSIETAIVSDTIRAPELVVSQYKGFMLQLHTRERVIAYRRFHCMKSVQIRSHFWSIFFCSRTEYGPEITPYLDNSHAVFREVWDFQFIPYMC